MLPPPLQDVGLSLTLPLAVIALASLLASIRALARVVRGADLAAVPLVPQQEIAIAEPGAYSLWIEGPLRARMPTGLRASLREGASGIVVRGERPWLRLKVGGFRVARRELARLRLERGGAYELSVEGLDDRRSAGDACVIFTRPIRAGALVARLVALLVSADVLILAVAASIFLLQTSDSPLEDDARVDERPRASATPAAPRESQSGGREILAASALSNGWREVTWEAAGLCFLAPADWQETAHDAQELMLRQAARRFYLSWRLTRFPSTVPFQQLTTGLDRSAAVRLEAGTIEGWALVPLGPAVGVAEISREGQVLAVWRGFVERDGVPYSLDILIGGGTVDDRDELESIFAAALGSIRFDQEAADHADRRR